MNGGVSIISSLIAGAVILLVVVLALRSIIKSHKKGACGESCGSCGSCNGCAILEELNNREGKTNETRL